MYQRGVVCFWQIFRNWEQHQRSLILLSKPHDKEIHGWIRLSEQISVFFFWVIHHELLGLTSESHQSHWQPYFDGEVPCLLKNQRVKQWPSSDRLKPASGRGQMLRWVQTGCFLNPNRTHARLTHITDLTSSNNKRTYTNMYVCAQNVTYDVSLL